MSAAPQKCLMASIEFAGPGLHTGEDCRVVAKPLGVNRGIVFRRSDLATESGRERVTIPAAPENVIHANHGTTLANENGIAVKTVEHLMAAFAVTGVDNVLVEVYGPEIPILDGSAEAFVKAIREVGLTEQAAPRKETIIEETIEIADNDRRITIEPADELSIEISIAFEDCLIGRQSLTLTLQDPLEQDRLACSRTFCRLQDIEPLRNAGLVQGGTLENSLVVDGAKLLAEQTLRDPQEFVLHKALDLLGDLYLLGGPIRGRIRAEKPGHDLNIRAAQAIARLYGLMDTEEEAARAAFA